MRHTAELSQVTDAKVLGDLSAQLGWLVAVVLTFHDQRRHIAHHHITERQALNIPQ